ncbi:MAG TPA: proteasome subunit beta [Candidatus Nanoarchaeia archaeon]|nr:proteasome subunit beta [Candidatus Nanoarchaeia archaeon]
MMDKQEMIKTGTTTIGIVCKDGIILAADKRATAGNMIVGKKFDKIHQIDDLMAVTIAGMVSDAQLLVKLIRAEIKLRKVRTNVEVSVKEAANLIAGMAYSNMRRLSMFPGIVAFLIGGADSNGYKLYNIGPDGSITEENDFTSDGSGSVFAYGVLETLYKKDMSVEEGKKLTLKALNAALQRDSASGSGFDIITITKQGLRKEVSRDLTTKIE